MVGTGPSLIGLTATQEDLERDQAIVPRLVSQEHQRELCEACMKWGDCTGWFADPFIVFAAASILIDEAFPLVWQADASGVFRLEGNHGLGDISLVLQTQIDEN